MQVELLRVNRETFQAFIAQDAHYLGTASTIYSQMLAKAPQGGLRAITAIQEMLEDTQEEVSLHVHFAEARTATMHPHPDAATVYPHP